MNEDPKFWEETILPWIQKLKAKQEEARVTLLELEAAAYSKAGYIQVEGINYGMKFWIKKEDLPKTTIWDVEQMEFKAKMKERRTV